MYANSEFWSSIRSDAQLLSMSANWAQTQGFIPQILTLPPCLACATASPGGTAASTAAAPGSCRGSSWGQRHGHCCSGSSCCDRGQGTSCGSSYHNRVVVYGGAAEQLRCWLNRASAPRSMPLQEWELKLFPTKACSNQLWGSSQLAWTCLQRQNL